jgi:hypothetical protein
MRCHGVIPGIFAKLPRQWADNAGKSKDGDMVRNRVGFSG